MFDPLEISLAMRAVIGGIVWGFANVIYIDLKRKGVKSFGRFVAFWLGTPTSWVSFFLVPEGRQLRFDPGPDDEQDLLAEIRRDRALRPSSAPVDSESPGPRDDSGPR